MRQSGLGWGEIKKQLTGDTPGPQKTPQPKDTKVPKDTKPPKDTKEPKGP